MSNYRLGYYQLSDLDLIRHYNQAKEYVLETLEKNAYLTEEQRQDLSLRLLFIPIKKGLLGRVWDKLFDLKPDETLIQAVLLKEKVQAEPEKEEAQCPGDKTQR